MPNDTECIKCLMFNANICTNCYIFRSQSWFCLTCQYLGASKAFHNRTNVILLCSQDKRYKEINVTPTEYSFIAKEYSYSDTSNKGMCYSKICKCALTICNAKYIITVTVNFVLQF